MIRKAKIVCTIGPASSDEVVLESMISAGMDVARLNMSHGDHDSHGAVIRRLRAISERMKREVGILLDLSGPKIRLGELEEPVLLEIGDEVRLTIEPLVGRGNVLPVRYPHLCAEVTPGDRLSLMDGLIHLEAVEVGETELRARVLHGGTVASHKGVHLPTGGEGLPSLTEKDRENLRFGLEAGVDWVSLSFVRSASDADEPRAIMEELGIRVPLMAKVEKQQALDNLDEIVKTFDGLMVARGDLGVEVELEDLPAIQKRIIRTSNRAAKPVITATQMLLSMVSSPTPTRAEVTDVANAILDGTDAVMLSEETAVGNFPAATVRTMASIAKNAARIHRHPEATLLTERPVAPFIAIAKLSKTMAEDIGACLIITPTSSGSTARRVSSTRPDQLILALSPELATVRQLALMWGVRARLIPEVADTDELFDYCRKYAREEGVAGEIDRAVVTAGVPLNEAGTTNLLKVLEL